MFPHAYHLLSQGETADSAPLIRELGRHIWARVRSAIATVAQSIERLPAPSRDALMLPPF